MVHIPDEFAAQVRVSGGAPEEFVNRLLEEASRAVQNGA